jgi:cell division protein FtsL
MRKRKSGKKRHSSMAVWVALMVIFMAELLVYSWCRVQYVHTGYEITEARRQQQTLIALQHKLEVEEALLKSPGRIRGIAEKRGLTMPDPGHMFVMP